MGLKGLQDLQKRIDKFEISYIEGGVIKDVVLRRESPKIWELAYYMNVMKDLAEKTPDIEEPEELKKFDSWMTEIRDELFMYFQSDNPNLKREHLDTMSTENTLYVLNKIISVYIELANSEVKKKERAPKPWETFESGLKNVLETCNVNMVDIVEWPYYRFHQEINTRSTVSSEEAYLEKQKEERRHMKVSDFLPIGNGQ